MPTPTQTGQAVAMPTLVGIRHAKADRAAGVDDFDVPRTGGTRMRCRTQRHGLRQRHTLEARVVWSQVHLQSREMRTATPAAGVVRADILAIRDLCRTLLPLDPAAKTSTDPELRAVVHGGLRAFREIAGWNARVLADLDATGQLHLPARSLTGAEVTDDPYLVAAKLRGEMVRVPDGQVQRLEQSYEQARALQTNELTPRDGRAPHAHSMSPTVAPMP